MEGEADPRNLLVVFSLVKTLIQSGLKLEPFVEELFEVVAAYFPIEFVPVSFNEILSVFAVASLDYLLLFIFFTDFCMLFKVVNTKLGVAVLG